MATGNEKLKYRFAEEHCGSFNINFGFWIQYKSGAKTRFLISTFTTFFCFIVLHEL